ncbi:hypothetical protein [Venatoribacter cucullus]|uniref:hypothetical protein n=1 Tax=Venatoribacter cucullus TaxID=2661630 RepID=UPI002240DE3E|nr:hypothetical protein [Venatoribacter cucullus]UZK04443.1 hypothetical protein GAY96_11275 [Venatoribacter cucullus]
MNIAKILTGMTLAAAVAVPVTAQEPTRGFMVERGSVAAQGAASVDLYTGGGYSGGAVRLGLGNGELVLNSGKVVSGLGINTSEAVFKLGLSNLNGMSEMKHSLAVYGGVSVLDVDGGASYTNLMVGAAFTADMNSLLLSIAPEFIIDDANDDNYLDVGLSAHLKMAKTQYGTFQPGIEVVATTADNKDTLVAVGVRWEYNDRLTLDIVPLQIGNAWGQEDTISLPGQMRLNARF